MKIYLCNDHQNLIYKSGVGKALLHQCKALTLNHIAYTTDSKDNYDIIHINTLFPKSYFKAKKAHFHGIPVVYHAHSTEEDFRQSFILSNLLSKGFKQWLKLCYNTGDIIVTPSAYSKRLLSHYQLKPEIVTVSNGIDVPFWQASDAEKEQFLTKYKLDENKPIIIQVGLPIERKGFFDFIALAKYFPDYQFIWFGDIENPILPQKIKDTIQNKPNNVSFPGYIKSDELRVAYQVADLYLFLTHEETEGITLLEALASQTACLVRDIPAFDYLTHKENIFKGKDLADFKTEIAYMLTHDVTPTIQNGFEIAKRRDLTLIGKKYQHIYNKLLN